MTLSMYLLLLAIALGLERSSTGSPPVQTGSDPIGMNILSFELLKLIAFSDPSYLPHHDLQSGSGAVRPGTTHFMGLIPVSSLPAGMPTSPNLRKPNLKTSVAKTMMESLRSNDGDFHLKNKGITLLASSVDTDAQGSYSVTVLKDGGPDGDGILDGGHTYATIQAALAAGANLDNQHVFVWIRVNVPNVLKASIAEALNNTANVSAASLANRRDEFGWLKEILGPEISGEIAWQQYETGKRAKVEELIAQLYAVNHHFRESSRDAYSTRGKTFTAFRRAPENFVDHSSAALDTLRLYEYIQLCFADRVLDLLGDRAIERKASMFSPIYDESLQPRQFRCSRSVSLALLGGLQAFLASDQAQSVFRLDRPIADIVTAYNSAWPELATFMKQHWDSDEVGGDPGAFGKRLEVWSGILRTMKSIAAATTSTQTARSSSFSSYNVFEELRLSPEELKSFWMDELEEAKRSLEEIRATIQDQRDELSQQSLHDLLTSAGLKSQRIEAITEAMGSLVSPRFGLCRSCNQRIELSRLYEPVYALTCVNC